MLMSAGEPLPTEIFVHDYLTVGGRKLGKSLGNAIDPVAIVEAYGVDALRWWLIREVPRVGDADFTIERLIGRYNEDLANGLGNLVNRTVSMAHKYRNGEVPALPADADLHLVGPAILGVRDSVNEALAAFDFRQASAALWRVVDDANRYIAEVTPWKLAKAEKSGDEAAGRELDSALGILLFAIRTVAAELQPFLPEAAERIAAQVCEKEGQLPAPKPLFPRLELLDGPPA